MRYNLIFIMISMIFHWANAEEKTSVIKSWKTFRSDYGYEFKYPDCWNLKIDDPDETGDFAQIKNLAVDEGAKCATPRRDPDISNGIGFYGGWHTIKSKEDSIKEIDRIEKWSKLLVLRKEHLVVKRFKLGSDEAISYVENMPQPTYNEIRWKMELYCPNQKIIIGGPTIREPDKSYYEKFKVGDLAIPEPEKTIYESIRCIEPKKMKSKSPKTKK